MTSQIIATRQDYRLRQLALSDARRNAAEDARRRKAEARREVERLPLSWTRKAVLKALQGYHFHYRGQIRKSVAEIAAKVKLSERTVQRALRDLEENGLIEISGETGRGNVRLYRVLRYVIKSAVENMRAALRRVRERVTQPPCRKGDTRASASQGYNTQPLSTGDSAVLTRKGRGPIFGLDPTAIASVPPQAMTDPIHGWAS